MIRPTLLALLVVLASLFLTAQTVTKFEGISAATNPHAEHDVDPNGAIGTRQYMEWANVSYQAWSKTSPYTAVWSSPQLRTTPWTNAGLTSCDSIGGDGVIIFDRLASRWVIAAHSNKDASGNYYYCVAVSSSAGKAISWHTKITYFSVSMIESWMEIWLGAGEDRCGEGTKGLM